MSQLGYAGRSFSVRTEVVVGASTVCRCRPVDVDVEREYLAAARSKQAACDLADEATANHGDARAELDVRKADSV